MAQAGVAAAMTVRAPPAHPSRDWRAPSRVGVETDSPVSALAVHVQGLSGQHKNEKKI